ncbi:MAG TPA: hypothetical protein VKF40_27205 [Burkholderiales bacterium]|nr:hypothetical protein [Burkholderiales bacterium]
MAGSLSHSNLLQRITWLTLALLALAPLRAAAHGGHDHEQSSTASKRAAASQPEGTRAASRLTAPACPGGSDNSCCCQRWPVAGATAKPVAARPAGWVPVVRSLIARFVLLTADETFPSRQALPSSPPRAPPTAHS